MQPIVYRIESHAKRTPQQTAIVSGNVRSCYAELWQQITVAARWYLDNGVRSGDTVLISTDSRDPFFAAAYFGAQLLRAIPVPVGFRTSSEEIKRRAELVDARLTLFGDSSTKFGAALRSSTAPAEFGSNEIVPGSSHVAEIIFTTGSTGEPKGVILSHGNIAASAELLRSFIGNTENDNEVVTVPMTHSFGLGRLRSTMLAGGTIVLVPGLTFPQLTIRALEDHVATGLSCVPAGIRILMSQYEERLAEFADQLRYMEMGSAHLSVRDKEILSRILPGTRLCMHYGLTEASRSTFLEFHADSDHLDSVGKPSPGVEVRIVDQSGTSTPVNEIGLIHVRAATIMQGYWKDEKRTEQTLDRETGWLNTGDLGCIDDDGYLHLAGRADDQINTGGVKIIPNEVENLAAEFPGVEDCGCVGVPDPEGLLGEVPVLFVVSNCAPVDSSELSNFLRKRFGLELPKIIIQPIDTLPRTDSGKLLRLGLQAKYTTTEEPSRRK